MKKSNQLILNPSIKSTDDLKTIEDLGPSEINFNPAVNNASTKLRKHQLLSIRSGDNDNSGFRYRKARNKIGGNEKDHWKEENLIHMVCHFFGLQKFDLERLINRGEITVSYF